jgi:hypothetical protein
LGIFVTVLFIEAIRQGKKREELRRENLTYTQQLNELNNVELSLKNLMDFVNLQKAKLKEAEDYLNRIRQETKNAEPALEAKREQINALFELQETRIAKRINQERFLSFMLGIIASLFASSLISLTRYLIREKKRPSLTRD